MEICKESEQTYLSVSVKSVKELCVDILMFWSFNELKVLECLVNVLKVLKTYRILLMLSLRWLFSAIYEITCFVSQADHNGEHPLWVIPEETKPNSVKLTVNKQHK